ncbi:hypothetical protein BGX21_011509 [Mortierella sp. AD011]|nr:hypothetical protein BGX20_002890 [Mortierella sp. AD010]KAF9402018.1 hypothetical protein BGX21_011509 [Mortierella sp. AD011]
MDNFTIPSEPQDHTNSSKATVPSIKKSRLVRSPTPHTLSDHLLSDIDEDSQSLQDVPPTSSSSSNFTNISNDATETANNSDSFIQYEKLSFFAIVARLTPEDLELARLTKANTMANRLIGKDEVSSSSKKTPSPPPSPSTPPKSKPLKRKSLATSPHVQDEYMADNELENSSEDDSASLSTSSTTSLPSSSQLAPPLPPSQLPTSESDQFLRKRRRVGRNHRHDTVTSENPQELDAAQLQVQHEQSPQSEPGPSASKETARPTQKKTVRFDETKNSVFGYRQGSTITFSISESDVVEDSNDGSDDDDNGDDDDDDDDDDEYEVNQNEAQSGPSPRNFLSTSPWWAWSSFGASGASIRPTPSDLESVPQSQTSNVSTPPSSFTMSLTPESSFQSQENLSQESSCQNSSQELSQEEQASRQGLFMDIASSLDRLWSPSPLRRSLSSVSSVSSSSHTGMTQDLSFMSFNTRLPSPKPGLEVIEPRDVSASTSVAATASTSNDSQCPTDGEDTIMMEESILGSLSPPKFDIDLESKKVPRKGHRSRDPMFPKSTSASPSLSPSHSSSSLTSKPSFKPPSLARAASFSANPSNRKAPPVKLRREASTTAVLDAFL